MSTDPHPHPVRATSPKPGPDKRGPDFVQDRPSPEADLPDIALISPDIPLRTCLAP